MNTSKKKSQKDGGSRCSDGHGRSKEKRSTKKEGEELGKWACEKMTEKDTSPHSSPNTKAVCYLSLSQSTLPFRLFEGLFFL